IDFWRPPSHPGETVDMQVSPEEFIKLTRLLTQNKIRYKVPIFDLQAVMNGQNDVNYKRSSWHNTYHTFDEIVSWIKATSQSSNIIRMHSLGKSYENRDQYILQIQANHQVIKPLVFINCGTHAREWISPASCIYIIDQIVSQYGKDPNVTALLDKIDLAIVPVFNVDGYVYTWTQDRLWRKNRSPNHGSLCFGTDLNRNWQFSWGDHGASENPCSFIYQGSSAMSEKEVQNLDRFLKSQLKRLAGFLDVHSYSQMWMIPWGFAKENIKDYDELMRVGKAAVDVIKSMEFSTTYDLGPSSRLLYINSGSLTDYVYGGLKVKYSFAVELRDQGKFGFVLPASQIEPTAKELFEGLKAMVRKMHIG
ncbi:unnamed protein product, partial [Pocillopora meandrina]